ncbi:NepR family anti-sigma factor [Ensifer sp. LCM 4579]|uniref:NepR family anti-sigma factor n=1 Tax=Ensifer sp. LCM 4579 TaxID=1848292 RepID=UPI00155F15D2|nr:NepR family anti-sigma factor [Ensifer sp. LCM 4579]
MKDSSRGGARGAKSRDPHAPIASKLKALYEAVEEEPVPQHFLDLLRRLDEAERTHSHD